MVKSVSPILYFCESRWSELLSHTRRNQLFAGPPNACLEVWQQLSMLGEINCLLILRMPVWMHGLSRCRYAYLRRIGFIIHYVRCITSFLNLIFLIKSKRNSGSDLDNLWIPIEYKNLEQLARTKLNCEQVSP